LVVAKGGFEDVWCAWSVGPLQVSNYPGESEEADSSSSNDGPSFFCYYWWGWREGVPAAAVVIGLVSGGVGCDGRRGVACLSGRRALT